MKFSFVVPVYRKSPETLKRCLSSLLTQSHKDIEIVAVFDGEDSTLEKVVDALGVQKLVIEHGGACKARNAGAKVVTGDYVAFWDADCFAVPEMVKVWETYLERHKCDFVYSGYAWADPGMLGFDSEDFDPWTIERFNYIASMFPLKRELVVEWDESLDGLQDWDYWRRVVKNGAKGVYIPTGGVAYPFTTEPPSPNSISGQTDKREARVRKIRAKYGDKQADILVLSQSSRQTAVELAKTLEADYFNGLFWRTDPYRAVIIVGADISAPDVFGLFTHPNKDEQLFVYWTGPDAESLNNDVPHKVVKKLKDVFEAASVVNLCDDLETQRILEDLGIEAQLVKFPVRHNTFSAPLPRKPRFLAYADDSYRPILEQLIKAVPDIPIDVVEQAKAYNMADYSASIQLTVEKRLTPATKNMLLAGRYVVSNVQEPYCGYVSLDLLPDEYKRELVRSVRQIAAYTEVNQEAADYYRSCTSPATFKEQIQRLLQPKTVSLEVK